MIEPAGVSFSRFVHLSVIGGATLGMLSQYSLACFRNTLTMRFIQDNDARDSVHGPSMPKSQKGHKSPVRWGYSVALKTGQA